MGVMHFKVPSGLSAEDAEGLRRAYLFGGYDYSPVPTRTELNGDRLIVRRDNDESSHIAAPWEIEGIGRLMGCSATLMERASPYRLLVELARGKVNQIRSQAFEWEQGGLVVSARVGDLIHAATASFGRAVIETSVAEAEKAALQTLSLAYMAAEALVSLYVEQLSAYHREHQEPVNSLLSCRLPDVPGEAFAASFGRCFNAVRVPLSWRATEKVEANYDWDAADRVLDWAQANQFPVTAGPLIDFSRNGVPEWLQTWEGDLPSIASFMCDFIETTVARYHTRIRRWVISTGSNCSVSLGLSEDDLIRLTARLAEAAWGIDSTLEVVIGLAQPWGEYLAGEYFNYSPFVFADTLLRAGLPLSGFELEWHMASTPCGTFCRDPLDASRLIDLFGMLGSPLQIAFSYPSSADRDALADPDLVVGRTGWWHGLTPEAQAKWAETFTSLALAKGYIVGVCWDHFSDAIPHRFPNAGLIDVTGNAKPAFDRLRFVRETYLKPSVNVASEPDAEARDSSSI